jgi:hypothetical protein
MVMKITDTQGETAVGNAVISAQRQWMKIVICYVQVLNALRCTFAPQSEQLLRGLRQRSKEWGGRHRPSQIQRYQMTAQEVQPFIRIYPPPTTVAEERSTSGVKINKANDQDSGKT